MSTKLCTHCQCVKPVSEFSRATRNRDGLYVHCKACKAAANRAWRAANPEKCKAHREAWEASEAGQAYRRIQVKPPRSKSGKRYTTSRESRQAYLARNIQKRRAWRVLGRAVREGRISPWPVCAVPTCAISETEAHHPDYSRPLDVVWLCREHHLSIHQAARAAGN